MPYGPSEIIRESSFTERGKEDGADGNRSLLPNGDLQKDAIFLDLFKVNDADSKMMIYKLYANNNCITIIQSVWYDETSVLRD